MKVYQVWFETWVGPIFSSEEKAVAYLEQNGEKYDPNDSYGYPDIRELEVDDPEEVWMDR